MRRYSPLALVASLLFAPLTPARAQSASSAPAGPWAVRIFVENDSPKEGTDEYYTNGLRVTMGRPLSAPLWGRLVTARRDDVCTELAAPTGEDCFLLSTTYALGQNMYTPRDLVPSSLIVGDRPYGGWLYGGMIMRAASKSVQHSLEIDLGVTGPWSLAGATQRTWHLWRDAQRPNGWEHQIGNHLAAAIQYEKKHRFEMVSQTPFSKQYESRWFDFIPHYGATVGNVFTFANAGFTSRIGFNISSDFGPELIRSAVPGVSASRDSSGSPGRPPFELYLVVHTEGRLVGRNIFVDENNAVHQIERTPTVGDVSFGGVMRVGPVSVNLRRVMRSREYSPGSTGHQFWAFGAGWSTRTP